MTALQSSSPAAAMLQRQLERQRARQRSTTGLVVTDADREREIADFEPTGPCRAHEDGTSQVCPLVVEYNDSLLATIGRAQSLPLSGEFTFVPDNGNWRMSDDFARRFTRAVTEARLIGMGVTDAVAVPE